MNGSEIKQNQKTYSLQSWSVQGKTNPIPMEKCEGIYMWDTEGNRYTDMSAQLVNLNVGFGNKEIGEAIKEQVDKYCFISPAYASEVRGTLAKKIISRLPDSFGKVFFTNGGAEANENAIKIARMFTGKFKVFSRYRSYHGSTFGAGNLTGEPRRYALEPGATGFVKFFDPYVYREKIEFKSEEEATEYYLAKLEEQIQYEGGDNIAALVVETITGTNGIIIPPKGYLPGVRSLCDKYGIIMVCDEVMTGWGRTGKTFGFENFDVVPDIVTFAKGVNAGYVPLGGCAIRKEIAAYFDENLLSCGLTYSGHPLACAAGVACLDYYEKTNINAHVQEVGAVLGKCLEELKEKHKSVGDVRYIGLFSAIELVMDRKTKEPLVPYGKDPEGRMGKILSWLKERKFMTYTHENMILIAPALIITAEQIKEELEKMDEVLTLVDEQFL